MRRGMIAVLATLSVAAMFAGGCANKEVVRSEEQTAATVKPDTTKETAKPESIKPETPPTDTTRTPEPPKPDMSGQSDKRSEAAQAFETVYFEYDKSDLRQDARDVLYKNAQVMLKAKPNAKVQIEGHCDERGSAEYNQALGERRAKSTMQYLITLGVPADRLSTISYGKEKPAVSGHDEAAWAKNRRAEFVAK